MLKNRGAGAAASSSAKPKSPLRAGSLDDFDADILGGLQAAGVGRVASSSAASSVADAPVRPSCPTIKKINADLASGDLVPGYQRSRAVFFVSSSYVVKCLPWRRDMEFCRTLLGGEAETEALSFAILGIVIPLPSADFSADFYAACEEKEAFPGVLRSELVADGGR